MAFPKLALAPRNILATTALALPLVIGCGSQALAAFIDLTALARANYSNGNSAITDVATGLAGGITYTITGIPNQLNTNEAGGAAAVSGCQSATTPGPLACVNDGFGISDDEVNGGQSQSITVTFSGEVVLQSVNFLDLYRRTVIDASGAEVAGTGATGNGIEYARITGSGGQRFVTAATDQNPPSADGGYKVGMIGVKLTSFVFDMTNITNTDDGTSDAALAAFTISAVPLPAAGILLLGGLAGIGFMSRHRAAA